MNQVRHFRSLTNGLDKHLVRMFLAHPEVGMDFPPSYNGVPMGSRPVDRKKRGNTPGRHTPPLLCGRKWMWISCLEEPYLETGRVHPAWLVQALPFLGQTSG